MRNNSKCLNETEIMKIFKTYSIETDIIETFFMKYGKEMNAHFKRDKQF